MGAVGAARRHVPYRLQPAGTDPARWELNHLRPASTLLAKGLVRITPRKGTGWQEETEQDGLTEAQSGLIRRPWESMASVVSDKGFIRTGDINSGHHAASDVLVADRLRSNHGNVHSRPVMRHLKAQRSC